MRTAVDDESSRSAWYLFMLHFIIIIIFEKCFYIVLVRSPPWRKKRRRNSKFMIEKHKCGIERGISLDALIHTGKRGAKMKMRTWESYWKSTTFHHQILINGHLHIQQQITVKQHRSFLNTIHIARMHCRLTKVTENYNNILFGNLCVEFLYDLSSKLNKERHPSWCSLR